MAEVHLMGAAAEDIKAGELICAEFDDSEEVAKLFVRKADGSCWMAFLLANTEGS